jgi:hypothetical protein
LFCELDRVRLELNHQIVLDWNDPVSGPCCQFDSPHPPSTVVLSGGGVAPIFPVEVWARIFHHLTDTTTADHLMRTCRYLWRISHFPLILNRLLALATEAPGWYCIPFGASKLPEHRYVDECINFSNIDRTVLHLTGLPANCRVIVLAMSMNVLHMMNRMMAPRFSH